MHFIAGKTLLVETGDQHDYLNVAVSFHETLQEAEAAIPALMQNLSSDTNVQEFFTGVKRFKSETDINDYEIRSLGIYLNTPDQ